jgi:hypothetical protein
MGGSQLRIKAGEGWLLARFLLGILQMAGALSTLVLVVYTGV